MTDVDLYGGRFWPQALAVALGVLLVGGLAGYRWMTQVTPVSQQTALDVFRTERQKQERRHRKEAPNRPTRLVDKARRRDREQRVAAVAKNTRDRVLAGATIRSRREPAAERPAARE